jgi:hypothetical protein
MPDGPRMATVTEVSRSVGLIPETDAQLLPQETLAVIVDSTLARHANQKRPMEGPPPDLATLRPFTRMRRAF